MNEAAEVLAMNPAIKTVGQLAVAMIDVLDGRGWCRGEFAQSDGKVCLLGAANVVGYGSPHPHLDRVLASGGDPEDVGSADFLTPAAESIAAGLSRCLTAADGLPSDGDVVNDAWRWNDRQSDATVVREALMRVAAKCADLPVVAS